MTFRFALAAMASLAALSALPVVASAAAPVKNIVLVHGAFADGSGWKPVADILIHDGYHVSIVQEPETSIADDVTGTKRILDGLSGPAVLVGHSYGGAVITEAGNDPNVASLVYVAAFAPDAGQTLGALAGSMPSAAKSITPTKDGYLYVDPAKFPADFAAGVPLAEAKFMAMSQVLVNGQVFGTPITTPAWKAKPSFAIVATEDRMINPNLERAMYKHADMTVTALKGSHAIFLVQPRAVAKVIEEAAQSAEKAS
ncbi:alpha/beta fold hydrolase [Acidisoma silvae]|uniref:Alpha/beta hydrolase n=1 Tax=Acidisoma silvae TaxID=2802396 RepID=A0A963YT72_9PROT|nr:alpha/beta hydrolase [Acidisoma silvae]MCB8875960.1 alpha/beta hydrolase [Acidisoma silvae]